MCPPPPQNGVECMKRWRSGSSKGKRGSSVDSYILGDHRSRVCFFVLLFILVPAHKRMWFWKASVMMNRKLNEQPLYSQQTPPHTEKPCERLERTMNRCSRENVWTDSADTDRNNTSIAKAHRGTVIQLFLRRAHGVPRIGRS